MNGPTDGDRVALPRLWLGVALLLWGVLTDSFAGALVMALLLEGIAYAPIKWSLRERDFHRAADLTSIIFTVVTVLQFSRYSVHGIYEILAVTPYCFFPLILVQRASLQQTIPLSALFYSLRRAGRHSARIDIAPHYLMICLVASSTTARAGWWYILATGGLLLGTLVLARPRRYRLIQSAAAIGVALGLAALTGAGLLATQRALESSMAYWFNQFAWLNIDPNSAVTSIGALGRLKLSDQIRVRVKPTRDVKLPLFLQEASYDTFKYGTWTATTARYAAIDRLPGQRAWALRAPAVDATRSIDFDFTHARELALLPMPRGSRRVDSTDIAELQDNRFGTLMSESPPGALSYRVTVGEPQSTEPPPTAADSVVPPEYIPVVAGVNAEVGLAGLTPAATAARIRRFFLDGFKYSLVQEYRPGLRTPLAHFLTSSRRGHCEYFATATVLLLRQAGVPSRYAVGYVVENYSTLERAYIARARHAHAWALAWIDGEWRLVDSTPSVWYELEEAYAAQWQTVQDLASWLWYRYQRLMRADWRALSGQLAWLVPPLALVLYVRLRRSPLAVRAAANRSSAPPDDDLSGALSPLFSALAALGLHPRPGETLKRFLVRAAPAQAGGIHRDELLTRYYRDRFGTAASAAASAELAEQLGRYCAGLNAGSESR